MWLRPRIVLTVAILAVVPGPVRPAASGTTGTARAKERVLESAVVAGARIELVVGSATDGSRPVRLRMANRRAASITMPWPATGTTFAAERVGGSWGAVDLLAPEGTDRAWASGDEGTYVATSMRAVGLPDGTQGVVVDQRAGFEHLIHAHLLAVVADGRLREVQRWVGVGAPEVTALAVTSAAVVFERAFYNAEPNAPDEVEFITYRFDRRSSLLVQEPRSIAVFTIGLGPFPSIAAARAAYATAGPCVAALSVIADGRGAIIGTRTVRRTWAEAVAARVSACSSKLHPFVR